MKETRPVLAIRPEPGLAATMELGRGLGLTMHGCPLSRVEPASWDVPDPARFDAILLGSANAIRHGGAQLSKLTSLPVHAVGETTAREAKAAGFTVTAAGTGGLQKVIDQVPAPVRYLRLVGSEYVTLSLPRGVTFEPVQTYAVVPNKLSDDAARLAQQGSVVLLHSAAMTRQFVAECKRLQLDRSRISLAAMGPRIAEPARKAGEGGWRAIHVSDAPNDTALLEMVRDVCI